MNWLQQTSKPRHLKIEVASTTSTLKISKNLKIILTPGTSKNQVGLKKKTCLKEFIAKNLHGSFQEIRASPKCDSGKEAQNITEAVLYHNDLSVEPGSKHKELNTLSSSRVRLDDICIVFFCKYSN